MNHSPVLNMTDKTALINVFKSCLNILRDSEGLTGEKALRNLSYLLILKLIEPRLSDEINIDNYPYDFSRIKNGEIVKVKLLEIVRFSNLANVKEDNLPINMKILWDVVLSAHPSTQKIFLKGKDFDIKHQSTYKKLIDKLQAVSLSGTDYDILGNAYEEVIQDIMTGKVFGQFFTPPKIKNIMVQLIDPQIHPDGTIETCCDPTMGTGGFLISCLHHIMKQATAKNINPNWEFIKTEGLYGKEIEPDTYQLAVSNMLISSGHMFNNLDNGDSIRVPITRKFDNILANPPFGIKGLLYDGFNSSLKSEYTPIKTDNAVSLFIQAIIYMLNIGGKCAVVLPDGQDLFSKSNKTLIAIREYLMKTCDLQEVICLPSNMFSYTSIKTCIFYFVKRVEGTTVLETTLKISKMQKVTGRTYKFAPTHQTTAVKFYAYDSVTDAKTLLIEVPIDVIASKSYSLNYAEYMKGGTNSVQYNNDIVIKMLGEVCDFQNGSQLDKKDIVEGNIPIFGGGVKIVGYHNNHNRNGNEIIICGTGYPGYVNYSFGNPFWASQCFTMKSKNTDILIDKYLYYYSKIVLEQEFMSKQKGTAQKFIRYTQVIDVKIPIPCIERQNAIVEYLDFINETSIKTSTDKIEILKKSNDLYLTNQQLFGDNTNTPLIELCEFIKTGKNKPIDNKTGTLYPYYGTGNITGYTDEYLFDGCYILTARNGTIGNCFLTNGKFFPSDHVFVIDIKDKCLMKYVYYILSNNERLNQLKTGVGIPNISRDMLTTLMIPVPSIERQREIVAYCEFNDSLIAQLEREIENNKASANQFMTSILTPHTQPDVADKTPVVAPPTVADTSTDPPATPAPARKVKVVKRTKPVAV